MKNRVWVKVEGYIIVFFLTALLRYNSYIIHLPISMVKTKKTKYVIQWFSRFTINFKTLKKKIFFKEVGGGCLGGLVG